MNPDRKPQTQRSRFILLLTDHAHLLIIAAASGLLHLIPLFLFPEYGYFRDEFYYIACAKRLAFGYVDHPPLAPFLLRLVLLTFGDSLLWGPPGEDIRTYIAIGIDRESLSSVFEDVQQAGMHTCTYCRENTLPIYVCRHTKFSIKDLWPEVKEYG